MAVWSHLVLDILRHSHSFQLKRLSLFAAPCGNRRKENRPNEEKMKPGGELEAEYKKAVLIRVKEYDKMIKISRKIVWLKVTHSKNRDSKPSLINAKPITILSFLVCNPKFKGEWNNTPTNSQMFFKGLWDLNYVRKNFVASLPCCIHNVLVFKTIKNQKCKKQNFLIQMAKFILPLHSIMMNRNNTCDSWRAWEKI